MNSSFQVPTTNGLDRLTSISLQDMIDTGKTMVLLREKLLSYEPKRLLVTR